MDQAVVIRPWFEPGRRIIAVSDVHGNLDFFRGLMDQVGLTPSDILVLVGDLLEKGPDSLALLRYVMELSRTHTVYPLCGNCDGLVLRFFDTDELDGRFYSAYLPIHPESTIRQLAEELGFSNWRDFPALRAALREAYPEIRAWLRGLPTILETEHLLFVHGGVPSREHMETLNRWKCMKNDNFLGQGHRFDKYVVVGHWPVTLYHPHIPSAAPLFAREQNIISIDGGCVLKLDGQLNALIFPTEDSDTFTWQAYDGLPVYTALDRQEARRALARCGVRQEHAIQAVATLSGGEQARVKLCLLTLRPCNFLLLDEPTNHLDGAAKESLARALDRFPGTVLLVSHEVDFYRAWAQRVVEIGGKGR